MNTTKEHLEEATVDQKTEALFLEWVISHKESVDLVKDRKRCRRSFRMWSPAGRSLFLQFVVLCDNPKNEVIQISYQKDARSNPVLFYFKGFQAFIVALPRVESAIYHPETVLGNTSRIGPTRWL